MKIQGFIALAVILNIFGNASSMVTPKNDTETPSERVFGGYLVPRDSKYKQGFTTLVEYYDDTSNPYPEYVCTGVIINENYIVSTAYCLDNTGLTTDGFLVYITGLKGTRYQRTITETHLHDDYDETTLENNIGVGKVNEPYDFATDELFPVLTPASDWGVDQFTGETLTVCGHRNPYTSENFYDYEPTCNIFIPRNRNFCTVTYSLELASNEICASSSKPEKFAVCARDFGAGLIYVDELFNFYLYALASYTAPYGCAEAPTAYLVVSGFVPWIDSIVN